MTHRKYTFSSLTCLIVALFLPLASHAGSFAGFRLDKKTQLVVDMQQAESDTFRLKGNFTLAPGSGDADPSTEGATLGVGSFSQTISAEDFTFKKKGKKTSWTFTGPESGLTRFVITLKKARWSLDAVASDMNLSQIDNPVPVSLQIGNYTTTTNFYFERKESKGRTIYKYPPGKKSDADGDGFSTKDGDCNDQDPLAYPGATDIPEDEIDQDCDGKDSTEILSQIKLEDYFRMPKTRPDSIPLDKKAPDQRPNFLREEPGGGDRLFVSDLYGYLFSVDKSTQQITKYLDFTTLFPHFRNTGSFAAGLITFVFHPDFASNGKFYTAHSEEPNEAGETIILNPPVGTVNNHTVLIEWTAFTPAADVFVGSKREILRLGSVSPTHPIGDLGFNPLALFGYPDYGLLYIAVGDGKAPAANGTQRLDTFAGTILRIDPDPTGQAIVSSNGAYSIPQDNPWSSDNDPDTLGEIYAYGFRNPHRLSWDLQTGDQFAMDIGEKNWEEVNRLEPGRNYGWRDREGNSLVGGDALPAIDIGYSYPVAQYGPGTFSFPFPNAIAISSGFVYRGNDIPSLQGKLITGDIPNGLLFAIEAAAIQAIELDDPTTMAPIRQLQIIYEGQARELIDIVSSTLGTAAGRVDLRLGRDDAGELYVITKQDGYVRRVIP